jgi:hypothetical protein
VSLAASNPQEAIRRAETALQQALWARAPASPATQSHGDPDLGVEAFEAAVGESKADRGEDAVAVLAQGPREPDERLQPRAGSPGQPGLEVCRRERGVGQVVEQAELFAQQEGAVEALIDLADLVQRRELADCGAPVELWVKLIAVARS